MSILEFQHVSKVYHNTTRALDDLSFSVNEGEFVSIIGPSGAGKSTILRCINRLIDATEGKIIYDGEDIMSLRKGQLRNVRTKTGMIFSALQPGGAPERYGKCSARQTGAEVHFQRHDRTLHGIGKRKGVLHSL